MEKLEEITPYQAAVNYINRGLAVFPLKYKGKTPLTSNGCKDATTDAAVVKAWWQRWPNANIGIATGEKSGGLFVIDLDIDDSKGLDGYHTLRDWERENGNLPDTWQSITGRGGNHLFFKSTKPINNRAGILDGVDIRGDGGYIVAPPSLHQNGRRYEWEQSPDEFELAEADENVFKLLDAQKDTNSDKEFKPPKVIPAGKRNEIMFKFSCSLQAKGLTDEAIIAAIKIENEKRCNPPLDDDELMRTIKSALKHEKGVKVVQKTIQEKSTTAKSIFEVKAGLTVNEDSGKIVQSIDNICEVIRRDPNLSGRIRYNTLSYAPFIFGDLPWSKGNYREWNNTDDSNLKCYIESVYGLKSLEKIMEALNIVIYENKFNPVVDYLEQLTWDGKPHIENLLTDYLGVKKDKYSIECMKLFMLGAINRAYYPGCKFDYMPVLVGEQGVGKSTFFKLLAGNDDWYNDNFNTVDGDKATEKLRGMWIVELAELLAVKKAQAVESIKAFITSTVDTYRPPYGRRTEQRPRVCVFAGTTNSTHFLTDRTGNRRYLPLMVNKSDVKKSMFDNREAVQEDFRQAWAEALHIYKTDNPKLVLPDELMQTVKDIQGSYIEEDVRVGIIQEWLDNTKEDYVCAAMIYELALGNERQKPDRRASNEIHDIMEHSIKHWKKVSNEHGGRKKLKVYGTQICYERVAVCDEGDGFQKIIDDSELPFM